MLQELPELCGRRKCSEGLSPPRSREAVYLLPETVDMGPPVVMILGERLIPLPPISKQFVPFALIAVFASY